MNGRTGLYTGTNGGRRAFRKCHCGHRKYKHEYHPEKASACHEKCLVEDCDCKRFKYKNAI